MEDRTIPNGETLPLSVFHVHNYGQRSGKNYVLSNGAGTEDLHVGKGWKLNVQQYMLPTGKTADGEIAYIYVDALGNEIGFAADKRYLQTGDAVIERTEFKDVEGMGLAEEVFLVGFDSNVATIDGLQDGTVDALIVQNPYAMGYLGVESAYRLLSGQGGSPEATVDTSTRIVNRDNMFTMDSQKALFAFE